MELDRVVSVTDVPDTRSTAVMSRLGMVLEHEATLEDESGPFEAVIYSITRGRWFEQHR
jgi:RimJ/RimL family protein N-acetyltransferase